MEIDALVTLAINTGNPLVLENLLSLISLPDNPYTVYAVNALRALTPVPMFRDYFVRQSAYASGRLAERLFYISRG
jgi:hypothetical protein